MMALVKFHCGFCKIAYMFLIFAAVNTRHSLSISDEPSKDGFLLTSEHSECKPVKDESYRGCACIYTKSGGIVNLNGLISNCSYFPDMCKKPRFTIIGNDNWYYSYHPCDKFSLFQNETHIYPGYRPCKDVAAARYTSLSTHECDGLGKQTEGVFTTTLQNVSKYITSNLTLSFQNKTTKNSAVISLICNENVPANESTLKFIGIENRPYNIYYMSLESKCCCPNGCAISFSPAHDRSNVVTKDFWYIIAIAAAIVLVLVLIVVYFIRRKKTTSPEAQSLLHPA